MAEKEKEWELKAQREFDEKQKALEEKIVKETQEKMNLQLKEKDKQLENTQKALEEAQRKARQGSQQIQGEVLELDLEKSLQATFLRDQIEPVDKGIQGADIIQNVCNTNGHHCGVILWEIKQTKHWTDKWVDKLKEDLRSQKANLPVIVTTVLPKNIDGFGYYQGVWVVEPKLAIGLATALRKSLIDVAYQRAALKGKDEKMEYLMQKMKNYE